MQDLNARARDGLRRARAVGPLLAACLAMALAACQAASPPSAAGAAVDAPSAPPTASVASQSSPAVATSPEAPPPQEAPAAAAAPPPADAPPARQAPVADAAGPAPVVPSPTGAARALVDRCSSDADCEVKDVGSCCGYQPRCLHRDSPTFADEVKARCKAEGRVSHCGIAAVAGCACEAGRCVNVASTDNQLVQ